jgi:hypothetical protein
MQLNQKHYYTANEPVGPLTQVISLRLNPDKCILSLMLRQDIPGSVINEGDCLAVSIKTGH